MKDLDTARLQINVRKAKGDKDRITLLPKSSVEPLEQHLAATLQAHDCALAGGYAGVELPYALDRKYPHAHLEWKWQYVFPAATASIDPRSGVRRRHHFDRDRVGRAVSDAMRKAGGR